MRRSAGLRQRLTFLYVGFFAVLLVVRGWFFHETLVDILERDATELLEEEFVAAKRFALVERGKLRWAYDPADAEESHLAQRVQMVFMLAGPDNRILEASDTYRLLPAADVAELRATVVATQHPVTRVAYDRDGVQHFVRTGLHTGGTLLSVGRARGADQRVIAEFTRSYYWNLPLAILTVAALGWYMAGRALKPLDEVAKAAQAVTASNFAVRIRGRGARDELDKLVDSFNSMCDRLEASFTQMRQFSANASHELRTPLTTIRAQLEVALMEARTPEQYRDAIAAAIEEIDRMTDLVKTLLRLSQAESGQVIIDRKPVDLGELADRTGEQYQLLADDAGVKLVREGRGAAGLVTGDRAQLQRLISNLISNAIKFTPPGGRIGVEVENLREAGVELRVSDNGRGIPAEHLPHIFERFYRAPEGTRAGVERGLGLGLSFVNWIAREHGARIDVSSEPGRGSRFAVRFPPAEAPPVRPAVLVN